MPKTLETARGRFIDRTNELAYVVIDSKVLDVLRHRSQFLLVRVDLVLHSVHHTFNSSKAGTVNALKDPSVSLVLHNLGSSGSK